MRNKQTTIFTFLIVMSLLFHLFPVSVGENAASDYGDCPNRILFVSVSGSDETGDGTSVSPWRTPNFAAANAMPGDTIVIGAGTYDIVSPIELPPRVSLEGEGDITVLTSSALTEEMGGLNAILRLVSDTGSGAKTDGCQHVSNIRFDGADTATQAIEVQNRNFVAIHDCTIVNFIHVGVGWRATDMGDGTPPEEYVTGGRFCNNYMKNNSFYGSDAWGSVYGRGALFCGGLKDFEIYGNTIIEDCRTGIDGVRGVPVKFWYYTGWMPGCKIHGNVIERLGSPTFSSDEVSWAFAIESAYHSGMDIYDNDFIGAVDLNDGLCGVFGGTEYSYAAWIHDNRFYPDPTPKEAHGGAVFEETAIILEHRTERTLIERNSISGYNQALYFNLREGLYDFTFRNNTCTELGGEAGSMLRMDGHGSDMQVINFSITDNLFEGNPASMSGFGIIIGQEMGSWAGQNISITENAVGNTLWNWLAIDDYTSIDGLTISNNTVFSVGGEPMLRSENDITGLTVSGNTEADSESWESLKQAINSSVR